MQIVSIGDDLHQNVKFCFLGKKKKKKKKKSKKKIKKKKKKKKKKKIVSLTSAE